MRSYTCLTRGTLTTGRGSLLSCVVGPPGSGEGYLILSSSSGTAPVPVQGTRWPSRSRTRVPTRGLNLVGYPVGVPAGETASTLASRVSTGLLFVARVRSENERSCGLFDVHIPGTGASPWPVTTGSVSLIAVTTDTTLSFPNSPCPTAIPVSQPSMLVLPREGVHFQTRAGWVQFGAVPETIKDTMTLPEGDPTIYVVPKRLVASDRGETATVLQAGDFAGDVLEVLHGRQPRFEFRAQNQLEGFRFDRTGLRRFLRSNPGVFTHLADPASDWEEGVS